MMKPRKLPINIGIIQWNTKQKHPRVSVLLYLILVFVSICSVGFLLLSISFLSADQTNKFNWLRLTDGKDLATKEQLRKRLCPEYGCPVYPMEHDHASVNYTIRQLLNESNQNSNQSRNKQFCTMTQHSTHHHFNQDEAVIIKPYCFHNMCKNWKSKNETDATFLILILDGHGTDGHIMARHVATELPKLLFQKLKTLPTLRQNHDNYDEKWISQQLKATFVEVNENAPPFHALRGGCTASLTLRIGHKLFFANSGDSRTILVEYPKMQTPLSSHPIDYGANPSIKIPYMTRLDKADVPEEHNRIEQLGGRIFTPQHPGMSSRVVAHSTAAVPAEPIGLAMSRSIGDWEWKLIGVTAEPVIDVIDLTKNVSNNNDDNLPSSGFFLLAASDGVWDTHPKPDFVANFFWKHIIQQHEQPIVTCFNLITSITPFNPEWYRDDMTIMYMPL